MNWLQKFYNYWTDDRGLLYLLISITVLMFIVYPFAGNSELSSLVTNIFLLVILVSGLISVDIKKSYKRLLTFIILFVLIMGQIGELYESNIVTHLHIISRIIFLWILIILIFTKVFGDKPLSFFYQIAGSLIIYLLIGFIWANMFYIFYRFSPDSFHFSTAPDPDVSLMFNFIYFSFTSLTTLGLGDILPVHPFLKSLVIMESILGPLYLAILIGRLVSKHRKKEGVLTP